MSADKIKILFLRVFFRPCKLYGEKLPVSSRFLPGFYPNFSHTNCMRKVPVSSRFPHTIYMGPAPKKNREETGLSSYNCMGKNREETGKNREETGNFFWGGGDKESFWAPCKLYEEVPGFFPAFFVSADMSADNF